MKAQAGYLVLGVHFVAEFNSLRACACQLLHTAAQLRLWSEWCEW